MHHFNLPKLEGKLPTDNNIIYFSCNKDYYHRFGYALIKSIIESIDFVSVHCHLILKPEDIGNITLLENTKKVSYTYEIIDNTFLKSIPVNLNRISEGQEIWKTSSIIDVIEKTYYASARFMRIAELFNDTQHVLQLDCDTVLRNKFPLKEFKSMTSDVRVMPKPKDPNVIIASAISLGTGDNGRKFKSLFSSSLINAFKNGAYWYVDQDVLKEVVNIVEWKTLPFRWNSWGIKSYDYFVTGKGDRKEKDKFKLVQEKWLPQDL
tara:strand:- start:6048 stop:6839 length:792 start_codon:yes stop_codon:yes gene_type:complete